MCFAGPLPLEPVHADSRIGEVRVVKPRLPMPVFRPEELGRNPEAALRALYADKPHQFHEVGSMTAFPSLLPEVIVPPPPGRAAVRHPGGPAAPHGRVPGAQEAPAAAQGGRRPGA